MLAWYHSSTPACSPGADAGSMETFNTVLRRGALLPEPCMRVSFRWGMKETMSGSSGSESVLGGHRLH